MNKKLITIKYIIPIIQIITLVVIYNLFVNLGQNHILNYIVSYKISWIINWLIYITGFYIVYKNATNKYIFLQIIIFILYYCMWVTDTYGNYVLPA